MAATQGAGLSWLVFALSTVLCWGFYGVLLHSGQVAMSDPAQGRYKAFLLVGVAYFLTGVLGSSLCAHQERSHLELSSPRHPLVFSGRDRGRGWCILRPSRLRSRWIPQRCDGHRFCRGAYRQCHRGPEPPSPDRRLGKSALAVHCRNPAGGPGGIPGNELQANPCPFCVFRDSRFQTPNSRLINWEGLGNRF